MNLNIPWQQGGSNAKADPFLLSVSNAMEKQNVATRKIRRGRTFFFSNEQCMCSV